MQKTRKRRKVAPLPPPRKSNVEDTLGEAYSEMAVLSDEMGSWADNLQERFSHTPKYEMVSQAAEDLERLEMPDIPAALQTAEVTVQDPRPRARGYSRADRMAHCIYLIELCIDVLEKKFEDSDNEELASDEQAASDLVDALREDLDTAESIEFPGAYG